MSFRTQRISWNLGAADQPTQDNSAVTYVDLVVMTETARKQVDFAS
jgi:hypothetical protein